MPENNKFDTRLPRLFAVTAFGSNSEKAGVIHPINSIPDLKVGATDFSNNLLYGQIRIRLMQIIELLWVLPYSCLSRMNFLLTICY